MGRIEPVGDDQPLRMGQDAFCHGKNVHPGGVGGHDAVRAAAVVQLLVDGPLGVGVLHHRLQHHVHFLPDLREFVVGDREEVLVHLLPVAFVRQPLPDQPVNGGVDLFPGALERGLVAAGHVGFDAMGSHDLGHTQAHGAGTHHHDGEILAVFHKSLPNHLCRAVSAGGIRSDRNRRHISQKYYHKPAGVVYNNL